ncbi:MAG: hypothetical protein NTX40_02300 [Planctomycetota bacterium]|nr:hypothetical protein [Planctomycetota bacterium]
MDQDWKVPENPADEVSPAASLRRFEYAGHTMLEIISRILIPPNDYPHVEWIFMKFNKRAYGADSDYVDFEGYPESGVKGIATGPDGNPIEGPLKIQVVQIDLAPQTAGQFPLRAEGLLGKYFQQSSKGGMPQWFWRAKVQDEGEKHIELTCRDKWVPRNPPNFGIDPNVSWLKAWAMDEAGNAQEEIWIDFNIYADEEYIVLYRAVTQLRDGGDIYASVKIQEGVLRYTPAGATRFVITASQYVTEGEPEYKEARIEVPILDARWKERTENKGFDPYMNPPWTPPWVVVGIGVDRKSEASQLQLSQSIPFGEVAIAMDENSGTLADISPDTATGALTPTDVTGKKKGPPGAAEAKKAGERLAALLVSVKQTLERNVKFYRIKDTGDHECTLTDEEAQAMLGPAATLWKDQAVVDLTKVGSVTPVTINEDLGEKPTKDAIIEKVLPQVPPPGPDDVHVVVLWDYDLGIGEAYAFGRYVIVKKASTARMLAHEVGHAEGLGHSHEGGNLMAGLGVGGGERIRKWQADRVNP